MKISLVTPYRCTICGYESNNQEQVKYHMRAWTEEHKGIRSKSKRHNAPADVHSNILLRMAMRGKKNISL